MFTALSAKVSLEFTGTKPKAFVIFPELKLAELNGIKPRAFVIFVAEISLNLSGMYPRAVLTIEGVKVVEANIVVVSLLPSEKFN